MAFETDEDNKIEVTMLDYNSLNHYRGYIEFLDGLKEIKFSGSKVYDNTRVEPTTNCVQSIMTKIAKQFQVIDITANSYERFGVDLV